MICGNTFLQDQFNLTQFRAVLALSLYHYSESSPSSISISVSEHSIQIKIRQFRCSPADFYLDFHISICEDPLLIPTFPRFPTLTLKAEFSWRILFSNHNILPHPFRSNSLKKDPLLLLMLQKSQTTTVWMFYKPVVNIVKKMVDFNYQPQLSDWTIQQHEN